MVKYCSTAITFAEVPDEISLSIQITNCQNRCEGCHSPFLRNDFGLNLMEDLSDLIVKYKDQITCVCFMGEGKDKCALQSCLDIVKSYGLKTCVYSGGKNRGIPYRNLDYFKVGPYEADKGGLNSKTTNQKMYKFINSPHGGIRIEDITYKFWPRELEEEDEN